eukprot:6790322-Prymnesium_polylepis.2
MLAAATIAILAVAPRRVAVCHPGSNPGPHGSIFRCVLPAESLVRSPICQVTGAGGQTGQAAFRKLIALPDLFSPVGIVRSEESKGSMNSRAMVELPRYAQALAMLENDSNSRAMLVFTGQPLCRYLPVRPRLPPLQLLCLRAAFQPTVWSLQT